MKNFILCVFFALATDSSYAFSETIPCTKAGAPECSGIANTASGRKLVAHEYQVYEVTRTIEFLNFR